MATERRLINKRAYEELVLLRDFCESNFRADVDFECGIEIDGLGKEYFVIVINSPRNGKIKLTGKNYAAISKSLMVHLSEQNI